ncbi:MAG TPA: hypothetical protein VFQ07_14365, partial [Candidatus Polarisedimenticolia bacterium]|nr:hypothetical protein [Candidatus Polarisedimenticolia bacterium]
MERRDFIRIVVTGSLAGMACGRLGPGGAGSGSGSGPASGDDQGPTRADLAPQQTRESNAVCHAVRDGATIHLPKPKRHVPIVIAGGGPAGLCAARFLGDRPYLLIVKECSVGG